MDNHANFASECLPFKPRGGGLLTNERCFGYLQISVRGNRETPSIWDSIHSLQTTGRRIKAMDSQQMHRVAQLPISVGQADPFVDYPHLPLSENPWRRKCRQRQRDQERPLTDHDLQNWIDAQVCTCTDETWIAYWKDPGTKRLFKRSKYSSTL